MTMFLNLLKLASPTTLMLSVLVIVLCTILFKRGRLHYLASKIPGPVGHPFFGVILELLDVKALIPTADKYCKQYGDLYKAWLGPWLLIVVSKPEYVQKILTNFLEKDRRMYQKTEGFIEEGLLYLDVEPWKVHRKIINPAFNQQVIDSYLGVFIQESKILVDILKGQVGKTIDVNEYLFKCSLDIICETAMDTRIKTQNTHSPIHKSIKRLMKIVTMRVFRIWLYVDFLWYRSSLGKEFLKLRDAVHTYTEKIIQNKRIQLIEKEEGFVVDDTAAIKRKSFIDIMLGGEGKTLTEKELRQEVSTVVFTGTDTVAITSSYALLCLGMHPELQEKVSQELYEIFGESDRILEPEDLKKMKYLEQFLKETMRLYSPVPVVSRNIDRELDLGDYVIPADTMAMISIFMTHRNPKVWKDPLKFDPGRFTPEEISKRHSYSYIPFIGGPRVCIGTRYAMNALKVIVSTVVRSFVVKTHVRPEDLKFSADVVLTLIGGFPIQLEKRYE